MKTLGIFSKLGSSGGSENRVVQLANSFAADHGLVTFVFAEQRFSSKLKPKLDKMVILRENVVTDKKATYEMQGVDTLLVVNSDSYSFSYADYWTGKQKKHHSSQIDISQIGQIAFLYNYVMSPAQGLVSLSELNPRIKILATCDWFIDNFQREKKFKKVRELNIPITKCNSPVGAHYYKSKTDSKKIRINRHSMGFSYKHDEDNLKVVNEICKRFGDKVLFHWVGVPSEVRDISSKNKDDKIPYKKPLQELSQVTIAKEYSIEIPDLLSETDILFFYISRHRKEPWPRTIAEGMIGECCCVTNGNYGMAEQIENGKTGYTFTDTEEAIEQLCDLIENPEKIKDIAHAAREYALENFLSSKVTGKMIEFIESGN